MSQNIFPAINPSTTSGTQLAAYLNDFKEAYVSGNSGTSRPSELEAGGFWIDTTGNPSWGFKIFDGVNDILVFTLNTATGTASIASADTDFNITKVSPDAIGAIVRLIKKRVAAGGQVKTADVLGEIDFQGTTETGTVVTQARIRAISTNDVTGAAQGAYIVLESTSQSSTGIIEIVRVVDGKVSIGGVVTPADTLEVRGSGIRSSRVTADAVAPKFVTQKARLAGNGQTLASDGVGTIEGRGCDDTGTTQVLTSIDSSATQNTTAAAQGSKISFKTKDTGSAVLSEKMTVETTGVNIPGTANVGTLNVTNLNATNTQLGTVVETGDAKVVFNKGGTQAAANAAPAGIEVEMIDAPEAQIAYDSTLASKWKLGEVGSLKEVITAGDTQTLTNKTTVGQVINSPTRAGVKEGTKAALTTYALTATNAQLVFATDEKKMYQVVDNLLVPVGGSSGGLNYLAGNPDFENGINGWAVYADAAAASPVDGTGGTANVTLAASTVAPLRGTSSGLFTKDAVNRQGQGFSYAFTIDSADSIQAALQRVSFDYSTSTNYVDDDMRVYVYDVTNAQVIEVIDRTIGANAGGRYVGSFQPNTNSTSYRLIAHVASVSALAYTMKIDNVSVGPQTLSKGSIETDFVPFVATGSWTTNTTYTGKMKRIGDMAILKYTLTLTGAPNAVNLTLNPPPGLMIDFAKSNNIPANLVGEGFLLAGGVALALPYLSSPANIIYVNYMIDPAGSAQGFVSGGGAVGATAPVTWTNGHTAEITVSVPIVGWSSNMILSEDTGNREIATQARGPGNQAIPNNTATLADISVSDWDTVASVDLTANTLTVRETGYYDLLVYAQFQNSSTGYREIEVFRTGSVSDNPGISSVAATPGTSTRMIVTNTGVKLTKGDVLSARLYQNSGTSLVCEAFRFNLAKRSNPQTIVSGTQLTCIVHQSSGQSFNNNTATQVVWDASKVKDTHNAMNTTTGVFTAPFSADYDLKAMLMTGSLSWLALNLMELFVYKNGVIWRNLCYNVVQANYTSFLDVEGSLTIPLNKGDTLALGATVSRAGGATLFTDVKYNHMEITARI